MINFFCCGVPDGVVRLDRSRVESEQLIFDPLGDVVEFFIVFKIHIPDLFRENHKVVVNSCAVDATARIAKSRVQRVEDIFCPVIEVSSCVPSGDSESFSEVAFDVFQFVFWIVNSEIIATRDW